MEALNQLGLIKDGGAGGGRESNCTIYALRTDLVIFDGIWTDE